MEIKRRCLLKPLSFKVIYENRKIDIDFSALVHTVTAVSIMNGRARKIPMPDKAQGKNLIYVGISANRERNFIKGDRWCYSKALSIRLTASSFFWSTIFP